MFHSGNRTQLKIDFVQVGQAEPLLVQVGQAEPSLDEMDHGVLAEEEEQEGLGPPTPLNPSNLASFNQEDRAEHCSKG